MPVTSAEIRDPLEPEEAEWWAEWEATRDGPEPLEPEKEEAEWWAEWEATRNRPKSLDLPAMLRPWIATGDPWDPTAVVEFRCAADRRERRGRANDQGALMGFALETEVPPVWSWRKARVARTGDGRRAVVVGDYRWLLEERVLPAGVEMSCRTGRHGSRLVPVAEVVERARAARDGGYTSVHI